MKNNDLVVGFPKTGSLSITNSGLHWNLEILVFEERGKPEGLENKGESKNQQQTWPTMWQLILDLNPGFIALVGSECSDHCTNHVALYINPLNPNIKILILISCAYTFPTEAVGRSW